MPIEKADFQRFMNAARSELPGASDGGIKSMLFDVLDEFCALSSAWTENVSFSTAAGVRDYLFALAEDGKPISLAGVVDVNNIGQPALMPTPGTISLRDAPNTVKTFTATVIKSVVLPTTNDMVPLFDNGLFTLYFRVILAGLVGRLMLQPNKPYTSAATAAYHSRRFLNGCAEARVAALRRNTFGAQAWRFPSGFARGSQRGGVSTSNPGAF